MLGVAWVFALPYEFEYFGFAAIVVALVIGYCVGEAVGWATNRKRGQALQVVAVAGVIASYMVRNVLEGFGVVAPDDVWGYLVVGIGSICAVQRLR